MSRPTIGIFKGKILCILRNYYGNHSIKMFATSNANEHQFCRCVSIWYNITHSVESATRHCCDFLTSCSTFALLTVYCCFRLRRPHWYDTHTCSALISSSLYLIGLIYFCYYKFLNNSFPSLRRRYWIHAIYMLNITELCNYTKNDIHNTFAHTTFTSPWNVPHSSNGKERPLHL